MVRLGTVALGGTQVQANAPRHEATGYARMGEREPQLAALVEQLLAEAEAEAEAIDAARDELYKHARRDELSGHLRTKEGRLEAIRQTNDRRGR